MKNTQKVRVLFSLTALLALLTFVAGAVSPGPRRTPASVRVRMQRLLGLSPQQGSPARRPVPPLPRAELVRKSSDAEMLTEDLRFQADRDNWVPAVLVKPLAGPQRLPAIICLPGTGGTRQQLADPRLQLSQQPRTGWARALSRKGFVTLSLDYRGSEPRGQNIFTDAVRAQLEGRNYMGELVHEVMRAVDYLMTRPDVDGARIGVTGFSLGGAMSWYAGAVDPRISVIVPVCGGAGTYDALLRHTRETNYHSQYFYPAGFLKLFPGDQPEVFASLAPRAALVVGRDQDQGMPIAGLRRLEQEVKAAYSSRGVADRFAVYVTAGDHTYTEEMFERVSEWFERFLKGQ